MIDVDLPETEGVPEVVRSFAACLASALERPVDEVPQPRAGLPGAVAHWRSWLAGHGTGLVSLAGAARFSWPGYWLAVLGPPGAPGAPGERVREADAVTVVLMFGTPAGVVLSPQDPSLVGAAALDLPVRGGFVVSGLDPAVAGTSPPPSQLRGEVVALALAQRATEPMRGVDRARAIAGRGLDGDRYASKGGTFTPRDDTARGYDLTLVEAEVLDRLTLPGGGRIGYLDARRNVVTRGIDLNALVGRRFRVGEAECVGQRLCEPCAHLERLAAPGALRGLIHHGGLRADVVGDGEITVGATIETLG